MFIVPWLLAALPANGGAQAVETPPPSGTAEPDRPAATMPGDADRPVVPSPVAPAVARPEAEKPLVPAAEDAEAYTVGPGDQLDIVVRKEPELTRATMVRPDGRITVPLIGDIDASGKTPQVLAEEITRGLGRFITAPRVTVGVGQAASARVYVIGQVARAGEVSLATPLTVVQALALAGGFKEFAKRESILIVGRDRKARSFNFKKFEAGLDFDSNVALRPGDIVVVP